MNAKQRRRLDKRRRRIARRLDRRNVPRGDAPVFRTSDVRFEVSEKATASTAGGVAAAHALVKAVGLDRAIDEALRLLKTHQPYHESDHVLNLAYVMLAGGSKIEDLERLREDEAYMNLLGAPRIPDPTTAGDFLRRFGALDVIALMDAVNAIRVGLWRRQPRGFRRRAVIDADGTITATEGEKKRGMALSYNGIWGYHPLLVSLANTKEPLYIVNRPGNAASHEDSAVWIDRAVALARGSFEEVLVRGDTDFSLTWKFDEWTEHGVKFVFGYDARENLVETAEALPSAAWRPLVRRQREVKTRQRDKRENTKDEIVRENGYENIRLSSEDIAEFSYKPTRCSREYRMVVVRKNLTVEKGETHLFDDVRYFFYVTNDRSMSAEEVVAQANERCDQENLIEQLKTGVNALRVPMYDLVSNWAYMVIASLAWTLKAWMGLVQARPADRDDLLGVKFKRFVHRLMLVPCQVVRGARRVMMRVLAYTSGVRLLFESVAAARRLRKVGVT